MLSADAERVRRRLGELGIEAEVRTDAAAEWGGSSPLGCLVYVVVAEIDLERARLLLAGADLA